MASDDRGRLAASSHHSSERDDSVTSEVPRRLPAERNGGQISLDFLFGITLFLFTFTYAALFIPGLFAPFESASDVATLQGDKTSIWLVEEKLVDDKSQPAVVNLSKLSSFLGQLNGSAVNQTLLRQEAGLLSTIRVLDLNVSVDWLNGTVNYSGNLTPADRPVGQTKRLVKLANTSLNESRLASHVVIDQIFNSSPADAVVLFNPTKDPVNIGGWVLGDGEQNLTFPNATVISPRGYLTVLRGSASSFVSGCTPDLEIIQTGVTDQPNVPNMINLTTGNFKIETGDEICLFDRNGPNPNLVDAVNLGTGNGGGDDDKCGGPPTWTLNTSNFPPATSGKSVMRINPGVEGSETSETSENWTNAFQAVTPTCPTTAAIISVRVW